MLGDLAWAVVSTYDTKAHNKNRPSGLSLSKLAVFVLSVDMRRKGGDQ